MTDPATDAEFSERRRAAYLKLDEAIDALHALFVCEEEDGIGSDVPVDAVLLIGSQAITDDGHRIGCVTICPRGGWQPSYLTSGLLHQAVTKVDGTECDCS